MKLLRIKEIQDSKGFTNAALASQVGVTPATISNINKESSFPKPELLLKIAKALDVDIRELFNQTKGAAPLNGFVEYEGEIFQIKEKEDLEKLIDKTNTADPSTGGDGKINTPESKIYPPSKKPKGLNFGG